MNAVNGKAFGEKSSLATHQRTHTGENLMHAGTVKKPSPRSHSQYSPENSHRRETIWMQSLSKAEKIRTN